jgi:hypothetical protein
MTKPAVVIRFFYANESPLWDLKPRLLNDAEEYLDDEYYADLGGLLNFEVVFILGQDDDNSGIIAFDLEGRVKNFPELDPDDIANHFGIKYNDLTELGEKLGKLNPHWVAHAVKNSLEKTRIPIG